MAKLLRSTKFVCSFVAHLASPVGVLLNRGDFRFESLFGPNVKFANTTTVAVGPMPFGALGSVHHHPPSSLPDLGEGYVVANLPGFGAAH